MIKSKTIIIKLKTIMNFDNNHEWIYAKNEFMMNNKIYDKWNKTRCEIIDETINNNKWDLQD